MTAGTGDGRKVLVTGAGGFLGSHCCQHFRSEGFRTWACGRFLSSHSTFGLWHGVEELLEIDLPSPRFARRLAEIQPDLLIHCASSASVPQSMKDPLSDLRQSTGIYGEILEAVRTESPKTTVVLLSSAAVYGQPRTVPTAESESPRPISPYGFHKWMCELLSREYAEVYGLKTLNLRIFSAYGERLFKQVVFDVLSKLHAPGMEEIELFGTGEETRDFLHARDIARAVAALFESGRTGTFNVGSGKATSIRELVEILARSTGSKRFRFRGQGRPGDPDHWCADISELRSTGFAPSVALEDGLEGVVRWFESMGRTQA